MFKPLINSVPLHHSASDPGWLHVPAKQRNLWQRLAVRSHGSLAPGNVISILGGILTIWGLVLVAHHAWVSSIALMAIGRFSDIFDGLVAERTGTKSPLGAALDATIDKLVIFAALGVAVVMDIVPLWVVTAFAGLNLANMLATLLAVSKGRQPHPSAVGKVAIAAAWICLGFFLFITVFGATATYWPNLLANLCSAMAVLLGLYALLGYLQQLK